MNPKLQVAFFLGVMTAEHIHGIRRKGNQDLVDEIFRIVEKVANGDLTLLSTPEEIVANLPAPPPELAAKAPDEIKKRLDHLTAEKHRE
jgi:hypothetical protein